jgi:formyltetrahydrofolate synthetase
MVLKLNLEKSTDMNNRRSRMIQNGKTAEQEQSLKYLGYDIANKQVHDVMICMALYRVV